MKIIINKNVVAWKLGRELTAAGIPHFGMSQFGNELEIKLANENQAGEAQVVINAHDGIDTIAQRQETAETNIRNIPGWATWSEADALNWWNTNLSDAKVDDVASLTDAKVLMKKQNAALKAMSRMLIALRDRLYPQMPEG